MGGEAAGEGSGGDEGGGKSDCEDVMMPGPSNYEGFLRSHRHD